MEELDVSVIVPVFNSARTLRTLCERLFRVFEGIGRSYEVVFVDDGSRDDSWIVLSRLQVEFPDRVIAIQLRRNFGQHNALMCGFRHSRGRYIITMDDDLQHPPEEIPKLLQGIDAGGLDLVYGCPDRRQHRAWRNLGSWLVNTAYRAMFRTRLSISAFRCIRRDLLETIFPYSLNYTFVDG